MLKVGIIGAGFMGGMHLACYQALGDKVTVAAVADIQPARAKAFADKTGAAVYASGMDLIAHAEVDAIDICLPTYLHTQHAIAAMEKGRAVFIEKPVCLTKQEGEALLACSEKTGAAVMVGQCIRFWPEYVWLKQAADSGRFGAILSGVLKRVSPHPGWAWDNWLHKVECSGSVALDMHIHDTDYLRFLMGEPQSMKATAVRDTEGVIQQMFTLYQYKNAAVMAEVAWDYPPSFPFCMEYRIKFEQATAVFNSGASPALMVYPKEGEAYSPEIQAEFSGSNDIGGNVSSLGGYYAELKYFIDRIASRLPLEVAPLSEAVKSVNLVLDEITLVGGPKV